VTSRVPSKRDTKLRESYRQGALAPSTDANGSVVFNAGTMGLSAISYRKGVVDNSDTGCAKRHNMRGGALILRVAGGRVV
jgi:hypothetical protein